MNFIVCCYQRPFSPFYFYIDINIFKDSYSPIKKIIYLIKKRGKGDL